MADANVLPKIEFDAESGSFVGLENKYKLFLLDKFPAINVGDEIKKMEAWLWANPKERKSNYRRFIVNWLLRPRDRAPASDGGIRMTIPLAPPSSKPRSITCKFCLKTFKIDADRFRSEIAWRAGICPPCYDDPKNWASAEDVKVVLEQVKEIGKISPKQGLI